MKNHYEMILVIEYILEHYGLQYETKRVPAIAKSGFEDSAENPSIATIDVFGWAKDIDPADDWQDEFRNEPLLQVSIHKWDTTLLSGGKFEEYCLYQIGTHDAFKCKLTAIDFLTRFVEKLRKFFGGRGFDFMDSVDDLVMNQVLKFVPDLNQKYLEKQRKRFSNNSVFQIRPSDQSDSSSQAGHPRTRD